MATTHTSPVPTTPAATATATATTCSPTPHDDEAVAIMAAVEVLWPKPVAVEPATTPRTASWRFSGRWWSRPVPVRRDRPWR